MTLKIVDKNTFDDYAVKHELNNLQQNSHWAEAESYYNWESDYLLFFDAQKVIGGTLILKKKWKKYTKLYAPRGILIDYNNKKYIEEATILLRKYIEDNNAIFLKIEPYVKYQDRNVDGEVIGNQNDIVINNLIECGYTHVSFSNDSKLSNNRFITLLNIKDKTYEEIYDKFTSKCKTSIKRAIESCITIELINEEEIDEFYKVIEDSSLHHSFFTPSLNYLKHLYNVYVKNNIGEFAVARLNVSELKQKYQKEISFINEDLSLLENVSSYKEKKRKQDLLDKLDNINKKYDEIKNITDDSIIVSGAIFITINKTMYYFLSGNNRDFINFNGSYLMQNEYIKKAINDKLDCYNFLGISGVFNPNHPRYGVINFKRGFNSDVIEFIGEFILVGNKKGYYQNELKNKLARVKGKIRKVVKK